MGKAGHRLSHEAVRGILARTTAAPPHPEPIETDAERRDRLAEEERLLAAAERSFEEEGGIPIEDIQAWIASWGTPSELPMPEPRKDEAWRRMMEARAIEKAEAERIGLASFDSPEMRRET